MKKLFSLIAVLCLMLCLFSCSSGLIASVSAERPEDKQIIEVESEDYGENAYFTTKKDIKQISVNKMLYDAEKDEYSLDETVYKKDKLTEDECLKIILDLQKEIPYVMVKYSDGNQFYEQYIYLDQNTGKLLLLERE